MPKAKRKTKRVAKKVAETIVDRWQNPNIPGSFSGLDYFYRGLKQQGKTGGRSKAQVNRLLENDLYYQSSRGLRKSFPKRHDLTFFISQRYEMDLGDLGNRIQNHQDKVVGRYYLLLIDLFSKKLFARALANKAAETVLAALKAIVKEDMKPPYTLDYSVVESDQGKEFVNKGMAAFLKTHQVYHSLSTAINKARYVSF